MKQTAVDWLVKKLNQKIDFVPMHKWDEIADIVTQSKAMEKEQIIDAYKSDRYPCSDEDAEQYYNETYGNT